MVTEDMKSHRKQLEFDVHKALRELSLFYKSYDDPLQYEVNKLWHQFDRLRAIPFYLGAKSYSQPQGKGEG